MILQGLYIIQVINMKMMRMNLIFKLVQANKRSHPLFLISDKLTASEFKQLIDLTPCKTITFMATAMNAGIGDIGLKILMTKNWPELATMYLIDNQITDQGIQYLVSNQWKNMFRVSKLQLDHNSITDQGVKLLAAHTYAGHENSQEDDNLNLHLYLGDNKITDQGVEHLVSHKLMKSINKLGLENNKITDKGMELILSKEWPRLDSLYIKGNHLSESMKAKIPTIQKECGYYIEIQE